jgi:hypothetical protein
MEADTRVVVDFLRECTGQGGTRNILRDAQFYVFEIAIGRSAKRLGAERYVPKWFCPRNSSGK